MEDFSEGGTFVIGTSHLTEVYSSTPIEKMLDSIAHPALMGTGNAKIFAVLCHCPAGHVNALGFEHAGNEIVGQRLARIFFVYQLFNFAFQQHQGSAASLRPMHAF